SSRRRHTRWPRDWSSDVCRIGKGDIDRRDAQEQRRTPAAPCESHLRECGKIKSSSSHAWPLRLKSMDCVSRVSRPAETVSAAAWAKDSHIGAESNGLRGRRAHLRSRRARSDRPPPKISRGYSRKAHRN